MIKTIIKRNGKRQPYCPEKLNGWGEWAANNLGKTVNWPEVVLNVAAVVGKEVTSRNLQLALIDYCLTKRSWAYNKMAGRLFSALHTKECYNSAEKPTLHALHKRMLKAGLLAKDFVSQFTAEEYAELNDSLKHERDLEYAYYQHVQYRDKYALRDRVNNVHYETPQFVMMRVAMRLGMNQPNRIKVIKKFYYYFSTNKINVPTPYYTNAGTGMNGMLSCCLYRTNDTAASLAAGDHIAYMMTVNSSGIGANIVTRSLNDPIRGGIIQHQGKLPYYRSLVGAIEANLQNGRGGAATVTYTAFDSEWQTIQALKNPMTPTAKRVRGVDYAMAYNRFFIERAAKGQTVRTFSYAQAPELFENMGAEPAVFAELYATAEQEGRLGEEVNARDILRGALVEAVETGRHYLINLTEANKHTPFAEPIHHSNLCVAGDTVITVRAQDKHEFDISIAEFNNIFHSAEWEVLTADASGKREWHKVTASALTANTIELIEIEFNGKVIQCTPEHKILTKNRGWVEAQYLSEDDELVD